MRPPSLEDFLKRIKDVSTLPHVAMKVVEVANNENSGASDLKAVMESDAALSARVLRCVNSAAFSLRTRVTNLQTAIAYLGCKQIRNLAMTASVADLFKRRPSDRPLPPPRALAPFRRRRHLPRLIAMRKRLVNFEDAFLAGLLHDLGIILLDQHAHAAFERVMHSLDPQKTLPEIEREQMGYDHTVVADGLAAREDARRRSRRNALPPQLEEVCTKAPDLDIVRCVENRQHDLHAQRPAVDRREPAQADQRRHSRAQFTRDDVLVLSEDLDREMHSHSDLFLM